MALDLPESTTFYPAVKSVGSYKPTRVVQNKEIVKQLGIDAEWVLSRTGIEKRHFASDADTVASMAVMAGREALISASMPASDLALVIVCSSTNHRSMPGVSSQVAAELEANNAGTYDLNAVCAGFSYGVAQAASAVKDGVGPVLVIGSEKLSHWLNPMDAGTYPIFADGAGAVLIASDNKPGISPVVWGNDGSRSELIRVSVQNHTVEMKGPLVYKWATSFLPKVVQRICARAGIALTDVDWLVLHQANLRIVNAVAEALNFPPDRVARDVVYSGNTSSASIPLALASLLASGQTQTGDTALLLGFGSGLTYSGQIINLP